MLVEPSLFGRLLRFLVIVETGMPIALTQSPNLWHEAKGVEMSRWASSLALIALVTCTADTLAQAPPVHRAPPVFPEIPQHSWRQGPPPDRQSASRQFTREVQRFAIAVRRLETSATAPSDRDLAHAIERFARALESTPYAEDVRVSRAVADMRAALHDASLAGPPGSPRARHALADALFIGEDVLLDLAYGPYQASREVTSRAWELENTLDGLLDDYSPNDPRVFVFALRQSVSVMNAMAQVRNLPLPPPPPPPPFMHRDGRPY